MSCAEIVFICFFSLLGLAVVAVLALFGIEIHLEKVFNNKYRNATKIYLAANPRINRKLERLNSKIEDVDIHYLWEQCESFGAVVQKTKAEYSEKLNNFGAEVVLKRVDLNSDEGVRRQQELDNLLQNLADAEAQAKVAKARVENYENWREQVNKINRTMEEAIFKADPDLAKLYKTLFKK